MEPNLGKSTHYHEFDDAEGCALFSYIMIIVLLILAGGILAVKLMT